MTCCHASTTTAKNLGARASAAARQFWSPAAAEKRHQPRQDPANPPVSSHVRVLSGVDGGVAPRQAAGSRTFRLLQKIINYGIVLLEMGRFSDDWLASFDSVPILVDFSSRSLPPTSTHEGAIAPVCSSSGVLWYITMQVGTSNRGLVRMHSIPSRWVHSYSVSRNSKPLGL